ncbi:hypothetical protein EHW12_34010 (plasmid) [Rhodococcus sp. NJ-530]|nr:hypothetical protein EHW12_34010 [Rhodococcus sp. NJ-530]
MLLEPASGRYFEPSEHAVLLGVFDGDHEWAVRGDEGFNDCLLPGRCDGSLGSSWTRRSRCGVDRRWCCGWTTDRISYPLCCNSSAGIGSVSLRSRQGHRGTTDTSNPYATDCGRNASTAITGRVYSKRRS